MPSHQFIAHTYGKKRTYAEDFTTKLGLNDTPYSFKANGSAVGWD